MTDTPRTCPHCDARLKKWRVPDESSWNEEFFFVCFNDDCPYYQEGWNWMRERFSHDASYRYVLNPTTGNPSLLPVWSDSATRDLIVEDDDDEGDVG